MIRGILVGALLAAGCTGDRAVEEVSRHVPPEAAVSPIEPPDAAHEGSGSVTEIDEVYPLKEWMSANLARSVKAQDFAALERALGGLATIGPSQFSDWRPFARSGASAAAAKDIDGVRASCADCHQKYRAEYRAKMRTRPLPEIRSAR